MYTSAFDILGPIMVGPSSSHTAGAVRIGLVARSLAPKNLTHVKFELYNSFAHTYHGHGTDRALVAGLLGMLPDDERVKNSFALAQEAGLDFEFVPMPDELGITRHPNTAVVTMYGADGTSISVTGESLGGGRMRISQVDGIDLELTGDTPTLFVKQRDVPGVLASITSILAGLGDNIGTINCFRESIGGTAYTVVTSDEHVSDDAIDQVLQAPNIVSVSRVEVPGAPQIMPISHLDYDFNSGVELLDLCKKTGWSIGELTRQRERELTGLTLDEVDAKMAHVIEVMRHETSVSIEHPEPSMGGLIGGQARVVSDNIPRLSSTFLGETASKAIAYAMGVLELSATMGVIVAAPTAGSAGIVPGCILSVAQSMGADDTTIAEALWATAGIGGILARNASVAGAEGGCQAEVGSASAMAAAALVQMNGGDPETALSAASTAIANLLGLVCDPVRGLVEYPCQDRNAIGVVDALSAAQLALSGVIDPLPFDEVVDAMKKVGHALPASLRETAQGGLAAEPSAATATSRCSYCKKGCCD